MAKQRQTEEGPARRGEKSGFWLYRDQIDLRAVFLPAQAQDRVIWDSPMQMG